MTTAPNPLVLWKEGFVVEADTGAFLSRRMFREYKPRGDGLADAFTSGRSRRVVRWPWTTAKEGEL
ncbi:MAG: hypothetical protein PHT19_05015 [Methylococcus sp.]|nr:hypothetical protein [Methylococcus sp.]